MTILLAAIISLSSVQAANCENIIESAQSAVHKLIGNNENYASDKIGQSPSTTPFSQNVDVLLPNREWYQVTIRLNDCKPTKVLLMGENVNSNDVEL